MLEPTTDNEQTYTQTEAAKICGVTQRVLVDRNSRQGYLSKLYHCFPGKYFPLIVEGDIKNQKKCRLTHKGVIELNNLIQAISPEPPDLDDNRNLQYSADGKVLKKKLPRPSCTLNQYAEFIWESQNIDGAAEHRQKEKPTPEIIEAAFVQDENFESSDSIILNTENSLTEIFQSIEEGNLSFSDELERRALVGYQQGRMLAVVEIGSREKGEKSVRKEWEKAVKNQSSRKLQ